MHFHIHRHWAIFVFVCSMLVSVLLITPACMELNSPIKSISSVNEVSTTIARENARQGTTDWEIPKGEGASIEIQAYANATSVVPGEKLTFYVSTQTEGMHYTVAIFRLGWYGGTGGRLVMKQSGETAHAQGYYNSTTGRLVKCITCLVDKKTGLVEARWHPSYSLPVPSNWVTGIYLAKFTDANDAQTYAMFDVRGDEQSSYILVTPDTTYSAYNLWGGYSLYDSDDEVHGLRRAVQVSFDRPYAPGYGSSNLLRYEINAIRWMERQGYDLSYMSSVDLHEHPEQLLQHKAYISIGHDEYWTKEMRAGVQNARDQGVGLAFLGANAIYWQMRFGADSVGVPDRTIICYKVSTDIGNLSKDPFYGKDNTRVTARWRDPVVNRPENALIGIMFSSYTQTPLPLGFPWRVNPDVSTSLLDGTGLQIGQNYGCEIVGYEWDRAFANGLTPPGLHIIAKSPTRDLNGVSDFSNTAYYIAPSGAFVFASGSIEWASGLDSYRAVVDAPCKNQDTVVPGMKKLMEHVMSELIVSH